MTYANDIKRLLVSCGFKPAERKPVREEPHIKPLTAKERALVEKHSYPERHWRTFRADVMEN